MENLFGMCAPPPAYAYCNPSFGEYDGDDDVDDGILSPPVYNFLESIAEETSDDLRSEESRSDCSERWGWDCSSTDAAPSVIHVPIGKEIDENEIDLQDIPRTVSKSEQLDRWLEESMIQGRLGESGSRDLECPSREGDSLPSPCSSFTCGATTHKSTSGNYRAEGELLILFDTHASNGTRAHSDDDISQWNDALDHYMSEMSSSTWDNTNYTLKRSASLEGFNESKWNDDITGDKFMSREAPPALSTETRGSAAGAQWRNPQSYDQGIVSRDFDESSSCSTSDDEINVRTRFVCQDLTQISKLDNLGEYSDSEDAGSQYECINGFVNCDVVKSRSLTDLRSLSDVLQLVDTADTRRSIKCDGEVKTRPSSENLSEDSGYNDSVQTENKINDEFVKCLSDDYEKKPYKIDVILEEEVDDQTTTINNERKNIHISSHSQCVKVNTCGYVNHAPIEKKNFTELEDSSGDFYTNENNSTWQDELMQSEWERSMQSGRATTDDWLFLKVEGNAPLLNTKSSRSLPSLVYLSDSEEDADIPEGVLSAPASMFTGDPRFKTPLIIEEENSSQVENNLHFGSPLIKETQTEKDKTVSRDSLKECEYFDSSDSTRAERAASSSMRHYEGAHRQLHSPNWEADRASARLNVNLDLVGSQQLARHSSEEDAKKQTTKSSPELSRERVKVSTDFGRQLSREFGRLSIKVNPAQEEKSAMFNSRPPGKKTIPAVPYVPTKTTFRSNPVNEEELTKPSGEEFSSTTNVERVQVRVVNAENETQRSPLIHSPSPPHSVTRDVVGASLSNGKHGGRHENNARDSVSADTAAKALEESYKQLEKAITCLQQDIDEQHAFYLHEEPREKSNANVAPARSKIDHARKEYFYSPSEDKTTTKDRPANITQVFDEFRKRAQEGRERVARSVLDLNEIERNVRDEIDRVTSSTQAASAVNTTAPTAPPRHRRSGERTLPRGPSTNGKASFRRRSQSTGYLETDIDTLQSREVINETPIDNVDFSPYSPSLAPTSKAFSMLSLRRAHEDENDAERARSMEFLLDAENKVAAQPPENQLMRDSDGRVLSEHELRIRRSLQRLNVPEWFKNSPHSQTGKFLLKKKEDPSNQERWPGLSSRTQSASSITSANSCCHTASTTPTTTTTRMHLPYCWRYPGRPSKESLSPSSSSTSPTQEKNQYFTRWGSFSSSASPTSSVQRPTPPLLTRQPYLGWRSSERLTREISNTDTTPTSSNFYRSAAERLSAGPGYYAFRYGSYGKKSSNEDFSTEHSPFERSSTLPLPKPPVPPKPTLRNYRSGVQQIEKPSDYRDKTAPDRDEECSKTVRQRVGWMESSFVGIKPDKEARKENTSPAHEEFSRGNNIPSPSRNGQNSDDSRLSKAKRSFGQICYDDARVPLKSKSGYVTSFA